MNTLFDFGISQEDANVEMTALDIQDDDNLLCIASAGEIPLNVLAKKKANINAVDLSLNQIYLSRLKLISSKVFEPLEAASFLGFMKAEKAKRKRLFKEVAFPMSEKEKNFWKCCQNEIEYGIIKSARFEKYISRFSTPALHIIGKANLLKLMELDSIEEQQNYFDDKFNIKLLKHLFNFIFNSKRYKNNAVPEKGLQHSDGENKSEFFFSRFREFLTSTPARDNYYLQFFLFKQILFPNALPDYLTEDGMKYIRHNYNRIQFENISFRNIVEQSEENRFNKFHLSNIGDWMSAAEFEKLLQRIDSKAKRPYKIFIRYLHKNHFIPENLLDKMSKENSMKIKLTKKDKFPFYNLVLIDSK